MKKYLPPAILTRRVSLRGGRICSMDDMAISVRWRNRGLLRRNPERASGQANKSAPRNTCAVRTLALPKKHRDDVAGSARECRCLVITHIFCARQFQGRKPNLSHEFHEFSPIGFKNPCELAKFAAKCSGFGALNDGYGLVGNHQQV